MASPHSPELRPLGTVLVTGGCGFLGHHLVRLLLERYNAPSTRVEVFDLRTAHNRYEGAKYHEGDLTNEVALRAILRAVKPDVIIHTASPVFLGAGGQAARDLAYKVNVVGTQTLLTEARDAGVKAFVYTSSASVINDTRTNIINADERWSLVRGALQKDYYSDTKVLNTHGQTFLTISNNCTPGRSRNPRPRRLGPHPNPLPNMRPPPLRDLRRRRRPNDPPHPRRPTRRPHRLPTRRQLQPLRLHVRRQRRARAHPRRRRTPCASKIR